MIAATARDRFVLTAARLFAERGYNATTVADIQEALELRAGSGALYKHFPSKRALLEAVVEVHLETLRTGHQAFADDVPGDVGTALRLLAEAVPTAMRRDRDLLRVLLRDLDAFPELRERVWGAIRADLYDAFAGWLRAAADRGAVVVEDPAATSAVLLASLTSPPILEALIDHPPGDVDAVRFADAWVAYARAALHAAP